MINSNTRPFLVGVAILLALSCAPREPVDSPPASNLELAAFFEDVFERRVAESPERQSSLGRKTDHLGEWDDRSDAFAESQIAAVRADLERLRRDFDRATLNDSDRLSYDLFEFDCERRIRNHEFRKHAYVVDQFNGQLSGLLTLLQNNHPISSTADAEDYLSRVEGLEGVLTEMTTQLRDRAELGVVPPAFAFPAVIADARRMSSGVPIDASGEPNALWSDFTTKLEGLELEMEVHGRFLERAGPVLRGPFRRGFETLIAELERLQPMQQNNHGVWALPDGDAYYQNRIENHTTLELSADDIHALGLAEVERIQDEMRVIQETVGVDGSLQDFFEFIRTDPNNFYENSDAGRDAFLDEARTLSDEIAEVAGQYFSPLPRASFEVRRVEPWRENSTSIAFYNRPSEDGSRPGIYYANLADMSAVQKYVFTAITYHEGIPGHHFQIALAQELEGIPSFRKFSGYGAFTEGWALYAEKLAKEMGFYAEPLRNFGRLQNELWRAARLVIDTGIHAKRWTREQSLRYFAENTPLSEGDIVTEVERFFVNPGQALSYKIGMNRILELRERARQARGEEFDLRRFHDAVIGAGALPLPLLERRVEELIGSD